MVIYSDTHGHHDISGRDMEAWRNIAHADAASVEHNLLWFRNEVP
jgi:hypothetical protein